MNGFLERIMHQPRAGAALAALAAVVGVMLPAEATVTAATGHSLNSAPSITLQMGLSASTEANYTLGALAFRRGDYAGAVQYWEQAGDQGHWRAQHNLGYAYATGTGVTVNYEQAAYWWQRAANQGIAEAQYNLGALYYDGHGVTQSTEQARIWWYRAANGGDAAAQFRMGLIAISSLDDGEENVSEATWWWQQSAAKGFEPAIQGLEMLKLQSKLQSQVAHRGRPAH